MSRTLQLTEQLIARPSITPKDEGCLEMIADLLSPLGFACERLDSGPADFRVSNLFALRNSQAPGAKTVVFVGHTDVVPTGPLEQWNSHPFTPSHRDGKLYGRGASDMKASVAAFVVAAEEFVAAHPNAPLNVAILLTSDEEGPSIDGTAIVVEALKKRGQKLDYCVVGEPTAVSKLGDMIKNGRRGSLTGKLTVHGVQGHIAYPQLSRNPIHQALAALDELAKTVWDQDNGFFPPTSFQMSNIHAGTGAGNVIPGQMVVDFNFRFSTESTAESLKARVKSTLERHALEYDLKWTLGGKPFLTTPGTLVAAVQQAVRDEVGIETELSTTGGTSDGRFIAEICPEIIEIGPPNASIHKIDEYVALADIDPLKNIYRRIMENLAR